MLCYLTLPGGRKRTFVLIKNQLKQSCIDMHQIRGSQHCLRSLNMIDCNNLIMYQLLFFCLSSLVAVFQCLKWYRVFSIGLCYSWQRVMSRKMPSNCFCQKQEREQKNQHLHMLSVALWMKFMLQLGCAMWKHLLLCMKPTWPLCLASNSPTDLKWMPLEIVTIPFFRWCILPAQSSFTRSCLLLPPSWRASSAATFTVNQVYLRITQISLMCPCIFFLCILGLSASYGGCFLHDSKLQASAVETIRLSFN